jgi:hypothetical protein
MAAVRPHFVHLHRDLRKSSSSSSRSLRHAVLTPKPPQHARFPCSQVKKREPHFDHQLGFGFYRQIGDGVLAQVGIRIYGTRVPCYMYCNTWAPHTLHPAVILPTYASRHTFWGDLEGVSKTKVPPTEPLIKSLNLPYALGALDGAGNLTKVGRQMGEFPTDPMLAKALIAATQEGCVDRS